MDKQSMLRIARRGLRIVGCMLCGAGLLAAGLWLDARGGLAGSAGQLKRSASSYGMANTVTMDYAVTEQAVMDGGMLLSASPAVEDGRKIVRTAQLDMEAGDLDAVLLGLQAQVSEAGGTVDYCEVSGQKGEGRYAALDARVPAEALDAFLAGAGSLGRVTRRVTQHSDMTSQYVDNASRLESARAQKQRLDELYAQAQDMTDIVAITDALFDVQQEIDSLTGANAYIDERAAFSRVNLTVTEPESGETDTPFLSQLAQSVKRGFEAIGAFFSALALFAAWALPWLLLLALAVFAVVSIRRYIRK